MFTVESGQERDDADGKRINQIGGHVKQGNGIGGICAVQFVHCFQIQPQRLQTGNHHKGIDHTGQAHDG